MPQKAKSQQIIIMKRSVPEGSPSGDPAKRRKGGPILKNPPPNRVLTVSTKKASVFKGNVNSESKQSASRPSIAGKTNPKPKFNPKPKKDPKARLIQKELKDLRALISQLYKDAPLAMKNQVIYDVIDPWPKIKWQDDVEDTASEEEKKKVKKSRTDLAAELFKRGINIAWMYEKAESLPLTFPWQPLDESDWIIFTSCLQFRVARDLLSDAATYEMDVPEKWLTENVHKRLDKSGAKSWVCKVVATISWHQKKFIAKRGKFFAFRTICDEFDLQVSRDFQSITSLLSVACCDPGLIQDHVNSVKGLSKPNEAKKLAKACQATVKKAKKEGTVMYKETLKLLEYLFPK